MPLIYRVMTRDGDKPKVGETKNMLGVRPGIDLTVRGGLVSPNTGGLSVGPALRSMPFFLVPKRLKHIVPKARGSNADACWKMGDGAFKSGPVADGLFFRFGHDHHGLVEPTAEVAVSEFQAALAATRDEWILDEQ